MKATPATLFSTLGAAALLVCRLAAQVLQTLHISVMLAGPSQQATPVARYALLISEDPPSAVPRRVLTGVGGSIDIKLRPGRYIIESEEPAVAGGRGFEWTESLEIKAGADASLVLDASNAANVSAAGTGTDSNSRDDLRTTLLQRWQESVMEIWTPTAHASGVLIDPAGLVATSARAVGDAQTVAVQFSSSLKVQAPVLATTGEISIVLVNAARVGAAKPIAVACGEAALPVLADSAKLFTLSAPMRSVKTVSVGFAKVTGTAGVSTDFRLPPGGAGGPVFDERGEFAGLTSVAATSTDNARPAVTVIALNAICAGRAAADAARRERGVSASDKPLPVEPALPLPVEALEVIRRQKPEWPATFQTTTADFDISLLTPLLLFAERREFGPPGASERTRSGRVPVGAIARPAPQRDFGTWREYVEELPPVLLIRVTPRQAEGFWTTVARGAALTQGIALPPIRHFKPGLARMQLLCDETDVTPIHPFVIEQRVSDTEAVREGLFVYDPAALRACRAIALRLSSEKEPARSETKVLDAARVQRVLEDIPQP